MRTLRSRGLRTDLALDEMTGVVTDRGDFLVIRTDSQPDYYWGNYLIMEEPPREGDYEKWIGRFEAEIGARAERGFVTLTWDAIDGDEGEVGRFVADGFSVEKSVILTAKSVVKTVKVDESLIVRRIESDDDWEQCIEIHFDPEWKYGNEEGQRRFIREGCVAFRKVVEEGRGVRFGVELDGQLVGDAGVYWAGELARFNRVGTHRDFRRRGVCSTLVWRLAEHALRHDGIETLVMEADEAYHAAAIYESIGFVPAERLTKLEWCRQMQDAQAGSGNRAFLVD